MVLRYVSLLYAHLLLLVHLWFLRISYFIRCTLLDLTLPARVKNSPLRRTVLIIGDGLAEGVGDRLAQGGPTLRLQKLMADEKERGVLKMNWNVVSLGRLHSDSKIWAVSRDSTLFEKTFVKGEGKNAHIVIVICGGGESVDDMEQTVERITGIAQALLRLGKAVVVATIPYYEDMNSERGKKAGERNKLLRESVERISKADGEKGKPISIVDVQSIVARGPDVLWESNQFSILNSAGYRSLARLLLDEVLNPARREEWKYWKQKLTSTSATRASAEA